MAMRYRSPLREDTVDGETFLVRACDVPNAPFTAGEDPFRRSEAAWLAAAAFADDPSAMRQVAFELHVSDYALSRMDDDEVRDRVVAGIASGELLGLGAADDRDSSRSPRRVGQLAREIERHARGGIDIAGDRYQLLVADDFPAAVFGAAFSVVDRERAERLLRELAEARTTSRALADLITRALRDLASTARSRPTSRGLVLVRPRRAAPIPRTAPEPAVTPSQMKRAFGGPASERVPSEPAFPPALIDQALQVQTLLDAAELGVPFCEECEKARAAAQAQGG